MATEVDNYSTHYLPLADGEARLNAMVQRKFDDALSSAATCNLKKLGKSLGYTLTGNLFFGAIEAEAVNDKSIPRLDVVTADSIYAGTPYEKSIVDRVVKLASVFNVAGHRVGSDKIGHFMDMGYDLYWREKRGHKLEQLVHRSRVEQQGVWGKWVTGVKSYGDIAANFDGYRFWKDVFGDGERPYFTCVDGRLKQVREFRWADYASPAWNEAINCSTFSSLKYNRAIRDHVLGMEKRDGRAYQCPIQPELCAATRAHYRQFVPDNLVQEIVSPLCR